MTTAAAAPEPVFVDTNVLVYANVISAPLRAAAQARLQSLIGAGVELWTSRQVLREYCAVLSRPQWFSVPVAAPAIDADLVRFEAAFRIAEDGPAIFLRLRALLLAIPVGGKQVHDANIVATMQAHGLRQLLTHNTSDFTRFVPAVSLLPL